MDVLSEHSSDKSVRLQMASGCPHKSIPHLIYEHSMRKAEKDDMIAGEPCSVNPTVVWCAITRFT